MYLVVDSTGARLEDPDNFRELDLRAAGEPCAERLTEALAELDPACTIDGDYVWIPVASLRALGRPEDAEWAAGFTAMIAYAAGSGWTRDGEQDVRLHVVP